MTLRGSRDANVKSASLAAGFVSAPYLSDPDKAALRLSEWLADVAPLQAAALEELFVHYPRARQILAGIAEASPYLFELTRSDAARALRVLQAEPDRHFARLIDDARQQVWAASSEAEAMQVLRRVKAEAALLIALCDIG